MRVLATMRAFDAGLRLPTTGPEPMKGILMRNPTGLLAGLATGALLLTAASCATGPTDPRIAVKQACSTYASSLRVLSAARAQGKLTPEQVMQVNTANSVVVPICTAPEPPTDAEGTLEGLNAMLEQMIFTTGVPK